ncbi:MAG TPA: HNH endonuclease signature motif containing protein, partial [Actinomycetes bacterium]
DAGPQEGGGARADGGTLAAVLRKAVSLLPAPLGAPVALLDLGRATRVVPPALRRALALRDGGCVAEGCGRPAAWCDAHHRVHWARGGATSLAGLVLVCRVHHVAAHEGGWRFRRDPASGRVTLQPPERHGHDPPAA